MFYKEENLPITVAQVMRAKEELEKDFNQLISEFSSTVKGGAIVDGFCFSKWGGDICMGIGLEFPKEPSSNGYYSNLDINFITSVKKDTEAAMLNRLHRFQKDMKIEVRNVKMKTYPFPFFEIELRYPDEPIGKRKLFGIF